MQAFLPAQLHTFITQMPKVELHLHLEGTVQPATLLEIAQRNRVEIPARDVAGVAQLFKYRSFQEFLIVFMSLARALVYGEDFEQIAYELGIQLAQQHVLYAEVMISPSQYFNRGLDLDEIIQGAVAGFQRAEREYGVRTGLVFDYGRQFGVEDAWKILEIALRNRPHVVAWSIGGDEANYPAELYAGVFAAARKAGLRVMAHAGEVRGAESVWSAVKHLHCERIGHGIRSADDPQLVAYLREHQVALDISITSNFRTGATIDPYSHPIRRLYDAGVKVTINTDDPTFFETTLTNEYRLAAEMFGFQIDDLTHVALNAAHAAFLPGPERDALVQNMREKIGCLRYDLEI
jgi:adenosine deaminase